MKWQDIMEECLKLGNNQPEWIELTGSAGCRVGENIVLYLPDVIWELYYETLQSKGKHTIFFGNKEWKKYEQLLWAERNRDMDFSAEARRLKVTRKSVTLLEFIAIDKYEMDENEITFPDSAYIPFHILYLENKEFFGLFTHGRKKNSSGEIIIKYGNLLNQYDENDIFRYTYEKLTGANLALLFAQYFKEMYSCFGMQVANLMTGEAENDEVWERNIDDNKTRLKNKMMDLMRKMLELPMIFGRILWAEIILQIFSARQQKYIKDNSNPDNILFCIKNKDVLNNIEKSMEEFDHALGYKYERDAEKSLHNTIRWYRAMEESKGESAEDWEEIMSHIKFEETFIEGEDKFARASRIYKSYKQEIISERKREKWAKEGTAKEENLFLSWKREEINWTGQWSTIKGLIEEIVAEGDDDSIRCAEIGKYLKKGIKKNPERKLPIIFIKEDVIKEPEYQEITEEFLIKALEWSQ